MPRRSSFVLREDLKVSVYNHVDLSFSKVSSIKSLDWKAYYFQAMAPPPPWSLTNGNLSQLRDWSRSLLLEEIRREDQQLWGGGGESSTSPHVRREHPESDIVKIICQKRRVQVPQLIMPSWTWNITECRCLNECHDFDVLLLKRIKSYFFNFDDNKLFFYYYIGLWRDSWCLLRSGDRLSILACVLNFVASEQRKESSSRKFSKWRKEQREPLLQKQK